MRVVWGTRSCLGGPVLWLWGTVPIASLGSLAFRFRDLLWGELEHGFAHFLAGLKLDDCSWGNGDVSGRSIRITADPCFPNLYFENSEIPEFNFLSLRDSIGNVVERFLHDREHILLNEPGFLADSHYQVTLCHSGCVGLGVSGWRAICVTIVLPP